MKEKEITMKDEIDLVELSKIIWSKKRFILKTAAASIVLGVLIALTSKVEYEASCKILPEINENGVELGGLGSIAGLAGFDLSGIGNQGTLSPELYPQIVKSEPFLNKIINTPIFFQKLDTTVSSFEYFKNRDKPTLVGIIKSYTIGLPGRIKKLVSPKQNALQSQDSIPRYSKEDWTLYEDFADRLFVNVDDETGVIKMKAEIPDPIASAQVVSLIVNHLKDYLTTYSTEKSMVNLTFVQNEFSNSKRVYEEKQNNVAQFTNQNQNMANAIIQAEYQRLQNELDIAFEVYKGLATQLEQAKIQVNQKTPVFAVLEPIRIPEDKSKPRRTLIVLISMILGVFVGIAWVTLRNYKYALV